MIAWSARIVTGSSGCSIRTDRSECRTAVALSPIRHTPPAMIACAFARTSRSLLVPSRVRASSTACGTRPFRLSSSAKISRARSALRRSPASSAAAISARVRSTKPSWDV